MVSSEQLLVLSVVLGGAKIPGSGSGRWVNARRQPTAKRRRRRHGRGGRELDNIGPRKTSPHRRVLLDRHQSRRPVVSRAARPRERATKAERGAGSAAAVPRSGAALIWYGSIRQCETLARGVEPCAMDGLRELGVQVRRHRSEAGLSAARF